MDDMVIGSCAVEYDEDSGYYESSFNFDDCDTVMNFDHKNGQIKMQNSIRSPGKSFQSIVLTRPVEISFDWYAFV